MSGQVITLLSVPRLPQRLGCTCAQATTQWWFIRAPLAQAFRLTSSPLSALKAQKHLHPGPLPGPAASASSWERQASRTEMRRSAMAAWWHMRSCSMDLTPAMGRWVHRECTVSAKSQRWVESCEACPSDMYLLAPVCYSHAHRQCHPCWTTGCAGSVGGGGHDCTARVASWHRCCCQNAPWHRPRALHSDWPDVDRPCRCALQL